MKIGTVSYNIYCNFTNYGSALQTWALHQAIRKIGFLPVLIDYCPNTLLGADPLNPIKNMWDQDEESIKMCNLSMPAIKSNYYKFDNFYRSNFLKTSVKYSSKNFNEIDKEGIDAFLCGSDTIFCVEEFGFDDGYYANYPQMKGKTISYAASFGDTQFDDESYPILNQRLQNFKAIGIREGNMLEYINTHTSVPCARTIDPTLLLNASDYDTLVKNRIINDRYLLLYARRYNTEMEEYATKIAEERGLKIVEISLRATNIEKGHIMKYDAGVEEFLSLVKYADFVITNSYHGLLFSIQYKKPIVVFPRESADNKINEIADILDIKENIFISRSKQYKEINYEKTYSRLEKFREDSLEFLNMELKLL